MTSCKRIPITQDMFSRVHQLRKTTGYGSVALIAFGRRKGLDFFKADKTGLLEALWRGELKTISTSDYETIIETYESIPPEEYGDIEADGQLIPQRKGVRVTDEIRQQIAALVEQPRQLSLDKRLKMSRAPKGLNAALLSRIGTGKALTLKTLHADWLQQHGIIKTDERG